MSHWLSSIAKLAAVVEGGIDRARYEAADLVLGPRSAHIVPYRGFGTRDLLHVHGRVLRALPPPAATQDDAAWRNLLAAYRRFESDEVPGARVRLALGGRFTEVLTDDEGFFAADLVPIEPLPIDRAWHDVHAELVTPTPASGTARVTVRVLVPPPSAAFGVVSDIDDTVLQTDVSQLLRVARNLLLENARTRLPFKGVAAFYRALEAGAGGSAGNPLFYVSSSPWNLHDFLVDFFEVQRIPEGPLMLRDWGITATELLPTRHGAHKLAALERILATYPRLPFLLIGDSGQEDPEIYATIIRRFPGRVLAAYIRNVSGQAPRAGAIRDLATEVARDGGTLLLLDDTIAAARHAAAAGWISPASLAAIGAETAADG